MEDISFDWSASDLRAEGLDEKIADGTIRQLRPMADNPWGIFLIEFNHPDAFTTGRGMTGPLRRTSKLRPKAQGPLGNHNLNFMGA